MKALSSPQVLHATVEGCFAQKNRTLWRLDSLNGNLYLLLVSEVAPNFEILASQLCTPGESGQTKNYTTFLSKIEAGQKLRFRFRGNPVHSVVTGNDKRGKVTPHVGEHHKREWLVKKAAQNGFSLADGDFTMVETGQQRFFQRSNKSPIILSYATFEGILTVTDTQQFITALTQGIGRGKAYGCGLMTVMVTQ